MTPGWQSAATPQLLHVAKEGARSAHRKAAVTHALFVALPIILTLDVAYYYIHHGDINAFDFHYEFWPAAQRLLHGLSPYSRDWMNIRASVAFPYPPFTAIAFTPLALIGRAFGDWFFTLLSLLAPLLTLRVLKVRDWRLYGLVMLWAPVVNGWQVANLTLLIGLGIAYLWQRRDHPLVAGAIVAVLISVKPFVWPLVLWLLATRRYRATAFAAVIGLAVNTASWAVVGTSQLQSYHQVVSVVNNFMAPRGYSVMALASSVGISHSVAYGLGILATAGLGLLCLVVGRRGDARLALALCVGVCLLGTPVLWNHYFELLIIPLALYRKRLDTLWLVPLALWVCPEQSLGDWPTIAIPVVVCVIVFGLVSRRPIPPPEDTEESLSARPAPGIASLAART